ncbi:unnamed protein product [Closterium sp. NIES-54]
MSNNGRKKAWPLMMTIANISQAKRWGKAGHTLLALLPIPPSAMSAVEKVMLFQRCVTTVLQPLLDGMESPLPVEPAPTPEVQVDYDRRFLAHDVWDSCDAAAALALTELLPPSEAVHFSQVETAKGCYDAIVTRYSTPSSASLTRLLMRFVFPDLGSFASVSDLVTHLRSLDTSYRATCTEAQFLLAPPLMWLTMHWLATRLPDRLSSARDALLQQHPSELTIDLLETTLPKIESNLLFVASATNTVAPRFFEGCAVP